MASLFMLFLLPDWTWSGSATAVDSLEQIMYLLPPDEDYSNFNVEKCLPSSFNSVSTDSLIVLMF